MLVIPSTWSYFIHKYRTKTKKFGDACVTLEFTPNPSPGKWVSNQRTNYKKYQHGIPSYKIKEIQIWLLNKIDFEWNLRDSSMGYTI